ncbi:SpoIIE family protein phosphatase [Streptomyces kronopolitis]|uniref:SpoIIE family protein phosphatase n=1 Tax=Streptomyces kronopolitis TaxID=1612435 RepID=UPI0020BD9D0D|nr:SpoIIE family protein phosphatase [Streptomyces kronopolitis]MCL6302926.1 SpoIIE family protein phosphatase [Streptomyces kronopolitis]
MLFLIGVSAFETVVQTQRDRMDEASARVTSVAETFASSPSVTKAIDSPHPSAALQPRAEAARKKSGVEFVVVTTPQGVRLASPQPNLIGKKFIGTTGPALRGQSEVETIDDITDGRNGRIVQAVAPVLGSHGQVVGLVSAGLHTDKLPSVVNRRVPLLAGTGGAAVLVAVVGPALVARRLRRQTRGLAPAELARLYEHHDAVLRSVREGVVAFDGEGRLVLANDEAIRLLKLPRDAEGARLSDLQLEPHLAQILASGCTAEDKVVRMGERLLAVNHQPTDQNGGPAGSVTTLRDTTELRALGAQAESARQRLNLLYEAGNHLGRSLDAAETAKELADCAVSRFADFVTIDLAREVLSGGELTPDSSMLRAAVSGVRGDDPHHPLLALIQRTSGVPQSAGMGSSQAVLVPSLIESAEWRQQDPSWARDIMSCGIHSLIIVPILARGEILGRASYFRSKREPFDQNDLAFAEELTGRTAISIDNARRFSRERTLAESLQRSLLPHDLPQQNALQVAHRYLPAEADAGGDWFDIIPLSGARVALVVGDIVGRGLHAAASMGRLRMAIHNFSRLDLPPNEILRQLDEIIVRMECESGQQPDGHTLTGARCLYAIYDPVTCCFSVALAGHPSPVFVKPDGTLECPDFPVGPPLGLGLGSFTFETKELYLAMGSDIALFTDGLIENRDEDIGRGLARLYQALAKTHGSPEHICDSVLKSVLPKCPRDDVALLVARTHALSTEDTAEWNIAPDPEAVAGLRADASRKLNEWGLGEESLETELIISELVTNAIRYSTGPIRVRLIRDRYLICEVYDNSSTSPHLQRASTVDEGGRGLYLISEFAENWGVRYTDKGKVIWTEQILMT